MTTRLTLAQWKQLKLDVAKAHRDHGMSRFVVQVPQLHQHYTADGFEVDAICVDNIEVEARTDRAGFTAFWVDGERLA